MKRSTTEVGRGRGRVAARWGQRWLVLAGIGLLAWQAVSRLAEPRYEGVRIRDWVHGALAGDPWDRGPNEQAKVVSEVLRERAVPYIVRELNRTGRSPLERRWEGWRSKLPGWGRWWGKDAWMKEVERDGEDSCRIVAAAYVLGEMGGAARPAIPALAAAMERSTLRFLANQEVFSSLARLGPIARAALPVLRSQPDWMRAGDAIDAIAGPGDRAARAPGGAGDR